LTQYIVHINLVYTTKLISQFWSMYSFWPNISTVFFVKKLHSLNSGSKTYWEAFVYFKCCLRPAANRKSLNSILVCYSRLDTYPIKTWVTTSEYCMIYKGPGFLAVARFGSSPLPPPPPSSQSSVSKRHTGRLRKRVNLLMEEGVGKEPDHTTPRKPGPL
jgi:hypothetical protein